MPERDGAPRRRWELRGQARADAPGRRISPPRQSRHREDLAGRPVAAAPSAQRRQRDAEKFVMRHASVKKITACRMHRMPQAVYYGVIRAKEEWPLASLRKPQLPLQSTSAACSLAGTTRPRALGSARCRPLLALRGSRSLRGGRARLLEAVAAIDVDMAQTHVASPLRAGTGMPFPRGLRSVRPGRITAVDVRVDIGLCIGRRHADDHRQNAQATDQSALHQNSSLSPRKSHTFYL